MSSIVFYSLIAVTKPLASVTALLPERCKPSNEWLSSRPSLIASSSWLVKWLCDRSRCKRPLFSSKASDQTQATSKLGQNSYLWAGIFFNSTFSKASFIKSWPGTFFLIIVGSGGGDREAFFPLLFFFFFLGLLGLLPPFFGLLPPFFGELGDLGLGDPGYLGTFFLL